MANTVEKELVITQICDSNFSEPVVLNVAEEFPDGESGNTLPTVTESDAGKILKVNAEGKWVVASL